MSANSTSNSDVNQLPNDGTRARANTVASMTASSTVDSIVYPNPSTPNLERDGNVVDETPAGQDDIATPQIQPLLRSSISTHRTLDLGDRVGDVDGPKVPHQLAASAQIESGGTVSSTPSVVTHGSLAPSVHAGTNEPTEGVHPSPDSDPFEFDDDIPTPSSVEHHDPIHPSDQVGADDHNEGVLGSTTSDQSNTDSSLSSNVTTAEAEENVDPDVVQQSSSTSDQSGSIGSIPTEPTTADPVEHGGTNVVQRSSTSDQSESDVSIPTSPTTVDTNPTLTLPAHFPFEQFQPLVHALSQLSYPSTFDGDIVMPDDEHLKLQIWHKGYKPSFGPRPAVSANEWAKAAKVEPSDMSKE